MSDQTPDQIINAEIVKAHDLALNYVRATRHQLDLIERWLTGEVHDAPPMGAFSQDAVRLAEVVARYGALTSTESLISVARAEGIALSEEGLRAAGESFREIRVKLRDALGIDPNHRPLPTVPVMLDTLIGERRWALRRECHHG
jgi:hypothetical protein